jgi:hypothetical protein
MSNDTVIDMSAAPVQRRDRASNAIVPMPDATPMQILAMAVQRGVDPDTLGKMMALQERWEANQARKAFEAAVAEAKAEIKPIVKRQEVDFTSAKGRTHYKYEGLSDIAAEVDPILAKHGLSYRHRSKQDGKKLAITCILSHRDGHSEETTLAADNDESGNKNSIQAIGSTATFLQRYTLKLALGLSAAKDTDAQSHEEQELITEKQAADLKAFLTENDCDIPKFLRWHKLGSLADIPAKNYDTVLEEVRLVVKNRDAHR